jgi:hypothetical protein
MTRPILLLLLFAGFAHAAPIQTQGPENYAGPNEISAHLGYQAGFEARFTNSSGPKLFAEYARRITDLVWFDLQLNNTFGFEAGTSTCIDRFGRPYACGGPGNGWDFQFAAGVKLKIKMQRIPLVVEIPIVLAIDALYNRPCGDTGVAPVLKPGVGVKYFLLRNIGIGGGFNTGFGPAFHQDSNCSTGYTDFYGAFDFQVGAEFLF